MQNFRAYSFVLPGPAWEIDPDAWTHNREFGFRLVKPKIRQRHYKNSRQRNRSDFTRDLLPKLTPPEEKYLFSVDIGFRHASGKMSILAASTSEADLAELFRSWRFDTLSPVPHDLIKRYLQVFPEFRSPIHKDAPTLTEESFQEKGNLHRGDVIIAGESMTLYGIPLEKDVLILLLRAQKDTEATLLKEGRQALKKLAQSSRVLR